ncbi:hypothetical protein RFI_14194 [Reticulomyxa filosa]|uniref:Uncharacterized protein n=1 Tax=Reticulomyxa filosa TaxID=46433 RepID=X6NAE7_RETFI|nr:hypothetical protein RFI_14194 [Reticulomyxa filosa]|eukprot:ETO22991.1 hypothetical protein RFI_14194 [Reticulomyxa filosa]
MKKKKLLHKTNETDCSQESPHLSTQILQQRRENVRANSISMNSATTELSSVNGEHSKSVEVSSPLLKGQSADKSELISSSHGTEEERVTKEQEQGKEQERRGHKKRSKRDKANQSGPNININPKTITTPIPIPISNTNVNANVNANTKVNSRVSKLFGRMSRLAFEKTAIENTYE